VQAAAAASFLSLIPQPHSSKQMTVIQPSGVKWVVNLLQLIMECICEIFTPRVQSQETMYPSWEFHVGDRSESSSTYDMIIGNGLISP
jgi:hypothetical protein